MRAWVRAYVRACVSVAIYHAITVTKLYMWRYPGMIFALGIYVKYQSQGHQICEQTIIVDQWGIQYRKHVILAAKYYLNKGA